MSVVYAIGVYTILGIIEINYNAPHFWEGIYYDPITISSSIRQYTYTSIGITNTPYFSLKVVCFDTFLFVLIRF
jgi:hypothetical protein